MRIVFDTSGTKLSERSRAYCTRFLGDLLQRFADRVSTLEVRIFHRAGALPSEFLDCVLVLHSATGTSVSFDARARHAHVAVEHAAERAWGHLRSNEWNATG